MDERFNLLLVCESEAEATEFRAGLPERLACYRPRVGATALPLDQTTIVLDGSWEVSFSDKIFDLCVFSLRGATAPLFMVNNALLRDNTRHILFIADRTRDLPPSWQPRGNHDLVLVRPFSHADYLRRVERLLLDAKRVNIDEIKEPAYLAFLKRAIQADRRILKPVYDPELPKGFFYPQVAESFGAGVDDTALLEHLVTLGMCRKTIDNRLRLCPACTGGHLNYRQSCPRCEALDFSIETIIHHFACGHMDSFDNYNHDGEMVCPKCNKKLRQIGLDYEKPAVNARCNACSFIFADARIEVQCLDCMHRCPPDKTLERMVYAYELTAPADDAVVSNQVVAVDLASVMRNEHTGLYAKQYFVHELGREMARFTRYRIPSSLLLVRLNNLHEVQVRHPERAVEYISSIFHVVAKHLRQLDLSCVWSQDILAVLLPATPLEGAQIVADRMFERCSEIDHILDLEQPDLTVSAVAFCDEYRTWQDLIQDAMECLAAPLVEAEGDDPSLLDQPPPAV
ncbi:MAG TPA: diguanylate cyclase [Kofleriaceae bacterium]|nr:diguanylate cyclase [Kofleriaceae bacterium]